MTWLELMQLEKKEGTRGGDGRKQSRGRAGAGVCGVLFFELASRTSFGWRGRMAVPSIGKRLEAVSG